MTYDQDKLQEFKDYQKTQFLASQFESELVKLTDAQELADSDPEMAELAKEEIEQLTKQLQDQFDEMDRIVESNKEEEKKPYGVMLEIRAGAGGDEASLFAAELAGMYLKYAEVQGWPTMRNNVSTTDAGGYKEASFEIMGNQVYDITTEQDQDLATTKLDTLGFSIDVLTDAQLAYLDDYSVGT